MINYKTGDFSFFVPVESISKAESKPNDKDSKRWIQGIASTDDLDLQGEKVAQDGLDYSYFLKHGYINDDHKEGPENKVGQPVEARITKAGFWIKGFLFKNHHRADHWWELINSLEQSKSDRKIGFSVQGKVKLRKNNTILKCWIQDVAITTSPVNTSTWAEISKSLSQKEYCQLPWNEEEPECVCKSCTGPHCDLEDEDKALSAGSGGALVPESLEGGVANQIYKSEISYDEAIEYLLAKGFKGYAARAIADSIFFQKSLFPEIPN